MVSYYSVAGIIFSMLISLGLPVGAAIYFSKRYKIHFLNVGIGAAAFVVCALTLESVLNISLLKLIPVTAKFFENPWLRSVYGGLAAGIFEEGGRFLAFMIILKKFRDWKDGVAYGIGHGGVEAIYIGCLGNLNNLIYAVLINMGLYDKMTTGTAALPSATVSALEQVKNALIQTNPVMFTVSGLERAMTFALQIALSLIVLYGIKNRKYIFLLYAVLIHAAVDFLAGLYSARILSIWVVEGVVFVAAVLSVVFIIKSKRLFEKNQYAQADKTA